MKKIIFATIALLTLTQPVIAAKKYYGKVTGLGFCYVDGLGNFPCSADYVSCGDEQRGSNCIVSTGIKIEGDLPIRELDAHNIESTGIEIENDSPISLPHNRGVHNIE